MSGRVHESRICAATEFLESCRDVENVSVCSGILWYSDTAVEYMS